MCRSQEWGNTWNEVKHSQTKHLNVQLNLAVLIQVNSLDGNWGWVNCKMRSLNQISVDWNRSLTGFLYKWKTFTTVGVAFLKFDICRQILLWCYLTMQMVCSFPSIFFFFLERQPETLFPEVTDCFTSNCIGRNRLKSEKPEKWKNSLNQDIPTCKEGPGMNSQTWTKCFIGNARTCSMISETNEASYPLNLFIIINK